MFILNPELLTRSCGCGSGKPYQECCYPFHQAQAYPITAEQLMRSRFVAFQLELEDYLLSTWSIETRPQNIEFEPGLKWIRLNINGRKKGRKKDSEGWVTFIAHYESINGVGVLHEKSYFRKNNQGHWQYIDGEIKD